MRIFKLFLPIDLFNRIKLMSKFYRVSIFKMIMCLLFLLLLWFIIIFNKFMKGVTTLKINEIYDYATFVREVNRYAEQQKNSNQKVFKALQDTIKSLDSMNKLNQEEANMYLQILFVSLTASNIKNN